MGLKRLPFHYLYILRPANLMMILLGQVLALLSIAPIGTKQDLITTYGLFILGTLTVAGAGYLINDYYDRVSDRINLEQAPRITAFSQTSEVLMYYLTLNAIALFCGGVLADKIEYAGLMLVFPFVAVLLYLYARIPWLKLGLGAVLISVFVAATILLIPWIETLRRIQFLEYALDDTVWRFFFAVGLSAFWLNLMREFIKDIQDINGDKNGQRMTLPIAIGIKRTQNLVVGMGVMGALAAVYWFFMIYTISYGLAVHLIAVILGLLFFCRQTLNAKHTQNFKSLSLQLKLIMLIGMLSLCWLYVF